MEAFNLDSGVTQPQLSLSLQLLWSFPDWKQMERQWRETKLCCVSYENTSCSCIDSYILLLGFHEETQKTKFRCKESHWPTGTSDRHTLVLKNVTKWVIRSLPLLRWWPPLLGYFHFSLTPVPSANMGGRGLLPILQPTTRGRSRIFGLPLDNLYISNLYVCSMEGSQCVQCPALHWVAMFYHNKSTRGNPKFQWNHYVTLLFSEPGSAPPIKLTICLASFPWSPSIARPQYLWLK